MLSKHNREAAHMNLQQLLQHAQGLWNRKPDRIPELGSEDSGHEVPLLVEELLPFNSYWGRKDLFVFLKEYDFW